MIQMKQIIQTIFHESDDSGTIFDHHGMMGIFGDGWWMWLLMIGGMILVPLLTFWTYQDATRRGENAALWAVVVFFTMGFGIILYALVRNPGRPAPAASGYSVTPQPASYNPPPKVTYSPPTQYTPKPQTGNRFCSNCGAQLELTDSFCSKCGNSVEST
jgi:hypothetical protein